MKNLSIKDKNKQFNKLTKAQQRVVIAKDVLKQINFKYLKPKTGIYVKSNQVDNNNNLNIELKELFDKDKSCIACGIGSVFVCAVKLTNNIKVNSFSYSTYGNVSSNINQAVIHDYLSKYFSDFELNKIEDAFEKVDMSGSYFLPENSKLRTDKAVSFFQTKLGRKLNATKRLQAIMNNIIRNNGTFNVTKKYGER